MKMKRLIVLPILLAAALAVAQPASPQKEAAATSHNAAGVVKSVDARKGTVTLAHGPVASLNWPAMTMTFKVQDAKILESLSPGKKVEVEFFERGREHVITKVK